MSTGQSHVVMPVNAERTRRGQQDSPRMATAIHQSANDQTHSKPHHAEHEREQAGPLKEILAHQDSLYKYISWEDPVRTLSSYFAVLAFMLGTHYMPLTRLALKGGAYALGTVSVVELVSRSFGPNNFMSRIRPKNYKKVPEPLLNGTLKDIHDFVQYGAVQAQRIAYGQDLNMTVAAFFGCTATYWLIKFVTPFTLSIIGLTSLYIAPLVLSPQAREIAAAAAHDGKVLAGDLTNAAVDNGKAMANSTMDMTSNAVDSGKSMASNAVGMASNATSSAVDSGKEMASNTMSMTSNATSSAVDSGKDVANHTMSLAAEQSSKARDTAADAGQRIGNVAQNSQQAAVDQFTRARVAASDITGLGKPSQEESGTVGEKKLPSEEEIHNTVDRTPLISHPIPRGTLHDLSEESEHYRLSDRKPDITARDSIPRAGNQTLGKSEPIAPSAANDARPTGDAFVDPVTRKY